MASAFAAVNRRRRSGRTSHFDEVEVPVVPLNPQPEAEVVREPAAHGFWTEGDPPEVTRIHARRRVRSEKQPERKEEPRRVVLSQGWYNQTNRIFTRGE